MSRPPRDLDRPHSTADSSPSSALEELRRSLPAERLVVDPDVLSSLSHDQAAWAHVGRALAGVRVRTEQQVQEAVRLCAGLGVPVVARGAGTGLSGGANAVEGCLMLDLSPMDKIVEIDTDNLIAVVQPGVITDDLKAAVAAYGLWYPPDPASAPWSTIGGNVATNAGGLCCLKYGVTREWVLGMRAVVGGLPGYGTAVSLGRRTTKGVAGYDLAGLMVGSEGTLGVITEVTVRLRPAVHGAPRTVVGEFPSLVAAGLAVAAVTRAGLVPAALELLDRACLQAVEEWKRIGLTTDAVALLLARVDTSGEEGDREADALVAAFEAAGASYALRSTDAAEAEALFAARRLAYPALERQGPVLTEDVCVPRSKVPAMLAEIEAISERHGVSIATIAHAGDGNIHPLLRAAPGDDAARRAAQLAFEDLLDAAIALGGTVTGEHGVGLLKREGMLRELDPASVLMQQSVKRALDPLGLFNPGKILPAER